MLAMISENVTTRLRYALDAKTFLIKIMEISFNTLNEIHENSLKFSDKTEKEQSGAKYKMPQSLK